MNVSATWHLFSSRRDNRNSLEFSGRDVASTAKIYFVVNPFHFGPSLKLMSSADLAFEIGIRANLDPIRISDSVPDCFLH